MDTKQKKYLIIGLEVVLLLLLLSIVFIVSYTGVNNTNNVTTDSFTHSANITSTSVEKIINEYGNYTLETIKYSDGYSEQRLYRITNGTTEKVSTTLIDNRNIVVGII